jgi:hypothetical protein
MCLHISFPQNITHLGRFWTRVQAQLLLERETPARLSLLTLKCTNRQLIHGNVIYFGHAAKMYIFLKLFPLFPLPFLRLYVIADDILK